MPRPHILRYHKFIVKTFSVEQKLKYTQVTVVWCGYVRFSRCLWQPPTKKNKKNKHCHSFLLQIYTLDAVPEGRGVPLLFGKGEIYIFYPRLLGSMVAKPRAINSPTVTLLRVLEPGSVLLVSNWTLEAISNARHSRPRPPSHIRNLRTQKERRILPTSQTAISWFFWILHFPQCNSISYYMLCVWLTPTLFKLYNISL